MSGIVNKAKEAVDKVVHPEHHKTGTGSTNDGPHNSNLANKADPRVGRDRDGSRNAGATTGTMGYGSGITGTTGTADSTGYGSGTSGGLTGTGANTSTNTGPHDSNIANKADPRIDSDLDGSRTAPGGGAGYSGGNTGLSGGDTGYSGSTATQGLTGQHGQSGLTGTSGQHGQSGLTGTSGQAGLTGTAGTGPASGTAGPHSSNLMNKADPRVDSDIDGSKTVGGNKTYTDSSGQPDASTLPPSEFRKALSQEHHPGDTDHARRHSLAADNTKNTFDKYGAGHQ